MVSNISKNIESLEVYNNYKVFLDSLSTGRASKEEQELMDQKAATKKLEAERRRTKQPKTKPQRGSSREGKNDIEINLPIPPELKDIVEDSDDDFQLGFQNESELQDIFTALEENNLLEIQRMQESEQELEQKKQQRAKTMSEYDKIIKNLLANEENNTARIVLTK